jgi:hypothetical protein
MGLLWWSDSDSRFALLDINPSWGLAEAHIHVLVEFADRLAARTQTRRPHGTGGPGIPRAALAQLLAHRF